MVLVCRKGFLLCHEGRIVIFDFIYLIYYRSIPSWHPDRYFSSRKVFLLYLIQHVLYAIIILWGIQNKTYIFPSRNEAKKASISGVWLPDTPWSFVLPHHYHVIPITVLDTLHYYKTCYLLAWWSIICFRYIKITSFTYHLNN